MILFHHKPAFEPIDPLADGLGDEIVAERSEPEAIQLSEQLDGELANKWEAILDDVHKDPNWFTFADDDEPALY